jgi:4-hydroxysphinganine ceramide fatty acyl 2-hydroxylase
MGDETEHEHSDSAYEMLHEFQVGVIGSAESTCSAEHEIDEHFQPEDTVLEDDYERNHFLDLSRPLIMQVWNADFSKSFYLQQVHQPRHLPHPARLFGPAYLEVFTRTPWYVVPLLWLPIAAGLFWRSLTQQLPTAAVDGANGAPLYLPTSALGTTLACFFFGNFFWTILEYCFHRFLFHVDDYLPDRPFFLMLHFLMHGIHHYLPMDGLRLVMPPLLFAALSLPFVKLAHSIFPPHIANGVISGSYTFYVRRGSIVQEAVCSCAAHRCFTTACTTPSTTPSCPRT